MINKHNKKNCRKCYAEGKQQGHNEFKFMNEMETQKAKRDSIFLMKNVMFLGACFGLAVMILFYFLTQSIFFATAILLLIILSGVLANALSYKKRSENDGFGPIQE